ncbi:low molecular weight protein-tyrosine-phosphatase [Mediterraneibacter agrestimuris]|uniref:low molecular weight protein-tyrosine-phosphatase n=1 Tax=Mediterraneibacter agrestimuris TaxID=2941333 RepID=UPI00203FE048|nr:low molecular weight protein-tyrosine-phosphatase [Mediterraneibacter agrestimuris]
MIKVLFVCHGNICRSTMAQFVFQDMINKQGLTEQFYIDSAATSREEIGNPPHHGTVHKLKHIGIPILPHRAVQMTKKDYNKYDYLIGMDSMNIRNMLRIVSSDPEHKICRLLDFTEHPRDIADPWYTGNFDLTYENIKEGCEALLEDCWRRL